MSKYFSGMSKCQKKNTQNVKTPSTPPPPTVDKLATVSHKIIVFSTPKGKLVYLNE